MSVQQLLGRLARLDARDRAWLLGELPPPMRRELAALLEDEPAASGAALPATRATRCWEEFDPHSLASVFEGEAAWLVSSATRGTEPRWRERLLQAMGTRRRHEIEIADRSGAQFGARAIDCVLEGCRVRLGAGVAPAPGGTAKAGFAALLDRMKERFA